MAQGGPGGGHSTSRGPAKKREQEGGELFSLLEPEQSRGARSDHLLTGGSGGGHAVPLSILQDQSAGGGVSVLHAATLLRQRQEEERRLFAQQLSRQQQHEALEHQLLLQHHQLNYNRLLTRPMAALGSAMSPAALSLQALPPGLTLQQALMLQQDQDARTQWNAGLMGTPHDLLAAHNRSSRRPEDMSTTTCTETNGGGYADSATTSHLTGSTTGDNTTAGQPSGSPENKKAHASSRDSDEARSESEYEEDNEGDEGQDDDTGSPAVTSQKEILNEAFPKKLYRILDDSEREGNQDIISFLPSGAAFAVLNSNRFVSELMPRYFATNRIASFQRQLNMYGFRRILDGIERGGYFHPCFKKRRKELLSQIRRKKNSNYSLVAESGHQLAGGSMGAYANDFANIGMMGSVDHSNPLLDKRALQMSLLLHHQRQKEQQAVAAIQQRNFLRGQATTNGLTPVGGLGSPASMMSPAMLLGTSVSLQNAGTAQHGTLGTHPPWQGGVPPLAAAAALEEQQRRVHLMAQVAQRQKDEQRNKIK